MYDELVKKIRHCATDPMHCLSCAEDKDGRCFKRLMTQAADAIEKMSEAYDKLSRHMDDLAALMPRWIPVTEQLIHSGWYLVACNEWGGSAVRKAIYDEATRKWLEFPCGGPKNITKFVTHYMRLPQPPKEEEA